MEIETEQVTYRVAMRCDRCGKGEMRSTGRGLTGAETVWEHRCDGCGHEAWFGRTYPALRYKDAGPR